MILYYLLEFALLLQSLDAGDGPIYPFNPQHTKAPGFDQEAQNRSCWSDNVVPYIICNSLSKYTGMSINITLANTDETWCPDIISPIHAKMVAVKKTIVG